MIAFLLVASIVMIVFGATVVWPWKVSPWLRMRRFWRRMRGPIRIPGSYPWRPEYGTTLFEDANRIHYADGMGGVVSIEKKPKVRRRAF